MQAEEAKSRFCRDFGWSTSLKPREITPQTTSRFPSNHVPFPSNHVPFPSDHESISLRPRVDFPQTTSRFPSNHESISLKPRKSPINGLKRDLQGIQVRLWWRRSAAKESTVGTVGSWRETRSAASLKPRISFPQTTSPPHYTCKWLRKTRR